MVLKENEQKEIPIVDMKNLHNTPFSSENFEIQKIASLLGNALHEYGFVYMTNHGISETIIKAAFDESRRFFELPSTVKNLFTKNANVLKNFHGYSAPGQELLNEKSVHEIRENFDVSQRERFYPTVYVPEFEPALETLEDACRSFDSKLLKILAMAIKLPDIDYFCRASSHLENKKVSSFSHLVSNYYPSIGSKGQWDEQDDSLVGVTRCAEHTDWETITLLFQDETGGLEIKMKDGQWIQAPPIPSTILVNIGDLLEIWTGGYFRATPHRVLVPQAEFQRRSARQSIAYFAFPNDHFVVKPLESEILSSASYQNAHFKPITAYENFVKKAGSAYRQIYIN